MINLNQQADGTYTLTIDGLTAIPYVAPTPAPVPGLVFSDNFDSGNLDPAWGQWLQNTNCGTGSTISVSPAAAYRGSNGVDIHYVISNNPAGQGDCQLHQDNNTCLTYNLSTPLDHFFVRGYFKLPFADTQMCSVPIVQRKLLYFKPVGWGSGAWAFFINMWPWPNCATDGYNLSVGYSGGGGTGVTLWGDDATAGWDTANNHVHGNKWYYIEAEVQYGATLGADTLRIWLAEAGTAPVMVLNRTNLTLRSQADIDAGLKLGTVEIGRQVDINRPDFTIGVDEHRHWDEIAIGTSRIGPVA